MLQLLILILIAVLAVDSKRRLYYQMIEITATGDTTLHTAGKYCPEDILVKVPAGGSGGATVETCTVTIDISVCPVGVIYTSALGEYVYWTPEGPGDTPAPFECVKGSLFYLDSSLTATCVTSGCELISSGVFIARDTIATITH